MRADQKALDAESEQQLGRRVNETSPELSVEEHLLSGGEVVTKADAPRIKEAFTAVEAVLAGRSVSEEMLADLSQQEVLAVRTLETAVKGKTSLSRISLFAEDRRDLLEQALATLQPLLGAGLDPQFEDLRERHEEMVDEVKQLRTKLEGLADAQEMPHHELGAEKKGDDVPVDDEDKPDDDEDKSDDDEDKPDEADEDKSDDDEDASDTIAVPDQGRT